MDAASHVVQRRQGEDAADDPSLPSRPSSPLPPLSALSMSGAPKDDNGEGDFEALPSQQQLAVLAAAMAHSRAKRRKGGGDKGAAKEGGMLLGPWGMHDTDELNLAGLLNVLDGVVRHVVQSTKRKDNDVLHNITGGHARSHCRDDDQSPGASGPSAHSPRAHQQDPSGRVCGAATS